MEKLQDQLAMITATLETQGKMLMSLGTTVADLKADNAKPATVVKKASKSSELKQKAKAAIKAARAPRTIKRAVAEAMHKDPKTYASICPTGGFVMRAAGEERNPDGLSWHHFVATKTGFKRSGNEFFRSKAARGFDYRLANGEIS